MQRLENLFKIWFNDEAISIAELLAFTHDHLAKLTAQNANGTWDQYSASYRAVASLSAMPKDESILKTLLIGSDPIVIGLRCSGPFGGLNKSRSGVRDE